jgi:high frequency lysogenization protein
MLNAAHSSLGSRTAGRCLAFAGMCQALKMVQDTAYGRAIDADAFEASLRSLFLFDAESVEAVYGGRRGVRAGLTLILEQLGATRLRPDVELGRYLVTLLVLERRLDQRMLKSLRTGLENLREQVERSGIDHPDVVAGIARLYAETISTLQPRVMVHGDPLHIAEPSTAHKIRALLLAAVRSAVLWRQLGGSRFKLLFSRRHLVADARAWLAGVRT